MLLVLNSTDEVEWEELQNKVRVVLFEGIK
jgi:hypothetical protein